MIAVPGYLRSKADDGYTAVLGSEPKADAPDVFLPAECVQQCVESGMSTPFGTDFALFILHDDRLTDSLREALGLSRTRKGPKP